MSSFRNVHVLCYRFVISYTIVALSCYYVIMLLCYYELRNKTCYVTMKYILTERFILNYTTVVMLCCYIPDVVVMLC